MRHIISTITLCIISIRCNSDILDSNSCNDECLLFKLGFYPKTMNKMDKQKDDIIINSYDQINNLFTNNALIWTNPSSYFSPDFMKQITESNNPTDPIFREILHQKYIRSNNRKLILNIINHSPNNNNNPQQPTKPLISKYLNLVQFKDTKQHKVQHILHQYNFDDIQYSNNEQSILTSTKTDPTIDYQDNVYTQSTPNHSSRHLLNDAPDAEEEFDLLNQHTYDEYDWFLYCFTIFVFGCLCLCAGWCGHKKYVKDKLIEDDDIESLATPMSESGNESRRKFSFNGFNIFGEEITHASGHQPQDSGTVIITNPDGSIAGSIPYETILSQTHGSPTLLPILPEASPNLNMSRNSTMSDVELDDDKAANRNLLTVTPAQSTRHLRNPSDGTIPSVSHSREPSGNNLQVYGTHLRDPSNGTIRNQQLQMLQQHQLYGVGTPQMETASLGAHQSGKSNSMSVMTMSHTPQTHYGAQVTMAATPIQPTFIQEDENGNIVEMTNPHSNTRTSTTDLPDFPNTKSAQQSKPINIKFTKSETKNDDPPDQPPPPPGTPPVKNKLQAIKNKHKQAQSDEMKFAQHIMSQGIESQPPQPQKPPQPSPKPRITPMPIVVNMNPVQPMPQIQPVIVQVMSNLDQTQKRKVPSIRIPAKGEAIVPRYADLDTPGTCDVNAMMSPASDEESRSHLSLEMMMGGSSDSNHDKSRAYGAVIPPTFHGADSITTPTIDEESEVEQFLENEFEKQGLLGIQSNRKKPPAPPRPKQPPPPQQQAGLDVIVEGTEEEETMSPESASMRDKIKAYEITADIIKDDIKKSQ